MCFANSTAFSVPITNREVERQSHCVPFVPITVTEIKPLSAGLPVDGSSICQYRFPSSSVKYLS